MGRYRFRDIYARVAIRFYQDSKELLLAVPVLLYADSSDEEPLSLDCFGLKIPGQVTPLS